MQHIENDSPKNIMFEMMTHCATNMRWMPLFPLTMGIILFLLGYYMEPESVRILFLILASIPIIMGVFGLLMISNFRKRF